MPAPPAPFTAMQRPVPVEKETAQATFEELGRQFKLEEQVVKKILDVGMTSLAEFAHSVNNEEELSGVYHQGLTLTNERVQVSRLKYAWNTVKAYEKVIADQAVSKAVTPDTAEEEDALLPAKDLQGLKEQFWRRHKFCFVADLQPADRLVSRCFRAMSKRQMEVLDLSKVRSLTNQQTVVSRKRKVGDNLYLDEMLDPDAKLTDMASYLFSLEVYLNALAIVGAGAVPSPPTDPEDMGSDPARYVMVPWQLLVKYLYRAKDLSTKNGISLTFLRDLDLKERAEWASRFNGRTDASLGVVIGEVYAERAPFWQAPVHVPAQHGGQSTGGPPAKQPRAGGGYKLAATLRDGTALCQQYQTGACQYKGRECQSGAHRCGVLATSGRVCGSFQHIPSKCDMKNKA